MQSRNGPKRRAKSGRNGAEDRQLAWEKMKFTARKQFTASFSHEEGLKEERTSQRRQ